MTTTDFHVFTHAEMLAARCELAAIRRAMHKLDAAMRKLDATAGDLAVDFRRARDYREARDLLADRCTDLRLAIEQAEVAWSR